MVRLPPSFKLTDTRFPYTTLCLSRRLRGKAGDRRPFAAARDRPLAPRPARRAARRRYERGDSPDAAAARCRSARPPPDRNASRMDRRSGRLAAVRSEEHTSELQSLMRISYAVFCLKKKKKHI